MKILLADDSLTAQNMGKKILTEAGHEVITASNGSAAVKDVSEHRPDLAILDVYMPGYSGLEVCEKIRAAADVSHIPVILTVGKLEPFKKEDAQRVGADALIIKPFEATELVAAVNRIAESLGLSTAATKTPPVSEKTKIKAGRIKLDMGPVVDAIPAAAAQDSTPTESAAESSRNKKESAAKESAAKESPDNNVQEVPEMSVIAPPQPAPSAQAADASRSAWQQTEADDLPAMKAAAAAASAFDSAFDVQLKPSASSPEVAASSATAPETDRFTDQPQAQPEARPELTAFAPAVEQAGAYSGAAAPVPENETSSSYGLDPAFSPDRTTWVSEFATRFGVKEDPAAEAPPEPVVPDAAAATVSENRFDDENSLSQSASAPIEAVSALSSHLALPSTIEEPETSDDPESLGTSPAADAGGPAADYAASWDSSIASSQISTAPASARWTTEELPVDEQESVHSLAEEMEKASAGAVSQNTSKEVSQENTSQVPEGVSVEVSGEICVEVSETISLKVSKEAAEETPEQDPEEARELAAGGLSSGISKDNSPPRPWPHAELYESSDAALPSTHSVSLPGSADADSNNPDSNNPDDNNDATPTSLQDRGNDQATENLVKEAVRDLVQDSIKDSIQSSVHGSNSSVQDTALESAAREAISLINAEMRAASADPTHASPLGTSAIEDMVSRVLQQLKPKLVAEITRELTLDSSKNPKDS